jgi:5-methylcytosine-specific restriction endonuclease McrA
VTEETIDVSSGLGRKKTQLYIAQAGECCYCGKVMLAVGDMTVRRFASLYGLTLAVAKQRVATLEHLQRRAEGGLATRNNVALACLFCNSKRHDKNWVLYKSERMRNVIPSALKMQALATT